MSRRANVRPGIKNAIALSAILWMALASCVPLDEIKEGITLSEAQSLLPFQICLPDYLPAGVTMSEAVRYHNEFGDPGEADISIEYYAAEDEEPVVMIYERHAPGRLSEIDLIGSTARRVAIRDLLGWMAGWPEVDKLELRVSTEIEVYNVESVGYRVSEIVAPEDLRAVLIVWGKDPVVYKVFARLSAEEAKRIADSISYCGAVEAATPDG